MDFAQIIFQGRLTDDPDLRTAKNGTSICKFFVATNRKIGKDNERTTYIPTTVFGKQAVICAEYLSKGREVHITGNFETDKYTDKEGNKRTGFGCIARDVVFGRGGTRKGEEEEEVETSTHSDEKKQRAIAAYIGGQRKQ